MQSRSYQILFIGDDSSEIQTLLQGPRDDEETFFEVHRAKNWQIALPQIASGAPDAVVWDLSDDGVDGLAYLREAHSQNNSVSFLALVSEGEKQLGRQALNAGAHEYLFKETLNKHLLQKVLRHLIERNRAENAVRQWERRFDEFLENSKDILFTMDLDGMVTSVNKAAEQVMGWSRSEALQKNIKSLVAPEHVAFCNEMMRRIVSEEPLQHFEIALLRKDGRRVLLEVSACSFVRMGGKKAFRGSRATSPNAGTWRACCSNPKSSKQSGDFREGWHTILTICCA